MMRVTIALDGQDGDSIQITEFGGEPPKVIGGAVHRVLHALYPHDASQAHWTVAETLIDIDNRTTR